MTVYTVQNIVDYIYWHCYHVIIRDSTCLFPADTYLLYVGKSYCYL